MAVQISGNDITVPRDGSFTRNVTIGGTLTYEDVTNIDSVGLVTARTGIEIGARPGVAASISVDGNMIVSGISTFGGALSGTTGTFSGAVSGTTGTFSGAVSGTTGTFSGDVKTTAATVNVKSGTSINTNSDTSAHGALHKNTNSGEFAVVSGGTGGDNHLTFYTSASAAPTEKVRIDSSGRVLVGHTGSLSEGTGFQVVNTSDNTAEFFAYVASTSGSRLTLTKSRSGTKGTNTVVQSGDKLGEIHFRGADGTGYIRGATISAEVDGTPGTNDMPGRLVFSTTADGANSQTERLRITSDGKCVVGNNSGAGYNTLLQVHASGDTLFSLNSTSGAAKIKLYESGTGRFNLETLNGSGGLMFYDATNAAERMRIDSSGRLLLNISSAISSDYAASVYITSTGGIAFKPDGTSTRYPVAFKNSSDSYVGSVSITTTNTSYNTSSDYRLKENEVTIPDAISKVKQLKPYRFNFKTEPSKTVDGFFAHEAQEVVSYAVTGEKDAEDMQQMDYGKLTPLLTAALKEAVTEIESLKSRLDTAGL